MTSTATVAPAMSLEERLVRTIRERGPLTFAEFMDVALYDPDEGFYAKPPVGREGHFWTSPHVSPAFADLLARQLAEVWETLGRPVRVDVVELGAGDATLARQLLRAAEAVPELARAISYVGVERTPGQLRVLSDRGLRAVASIREVAPVRGVVLGNEVLDNVPFHRVRATDGVVKEIMVGERAGRLVETESSPSPAVTSLLGGRSAPTGERPVAPSLGELVGEIAAALERGYALLFDYGFTGDETPGPTHAYRGHAALEDVLAEPGSRDITAAVDLDAVADAARAAGLQVWGPISQREALLSLGYRLWMSGVRRRQAEAEGAGDARAAARLYEARSRASILVDESKLGALRLLTFGTEGLPPPAAALGDRQTGC